MKKYLFIIFVLILTSSCSNDEPSLVQGSISFGTYEVSPPMGYWYYPRSYPKEFTDSDFFLLTFFKSKKRNVERDIRETSFNVGVSLNNYTDFSQYYDQAKMHNAEYGVLPTKINRMLDFNGWSCMDQNTDGFFTVSCVSLRKELITISASGKSVNSVLKDIELFKTLITTFKEVEK